MVASVVHFHVCESAGVGLCFSKEACVHEVLSLLFAVASVPRELPTASTITLLLAFISGSQLSSCLPSSSPLHYLTVYFCACSNNGSCLCAYIMYAAHVTLLLLECTP